MLKAVLFGRENASCVVLETAAIESKLVSFVKTLRHFPKTYELAKILNSYAPDLVFLDIDEWESAESVARDTQAVVPSAAIVGFGAIWASRREEQCRAAGIAELLISPVTVQVVRTLRSGARHPQGALHGDPG